MLQQHLFNMFKFKPSYSRKEKDTQNEVTLKLASHSVRQYVLMAGLLRIWGKACQVANPNRGPLCSSSDIATFRCDLRWMKFSLPASATWKCQRMSACGKTPTALRGQLASVRPTKWDSNPAAMVNSFIRVASCSKESTDSYQSIDENIGEST